MIDETTSEIKQRKQEIKKKVKKRFFAPKENGLRGYL